ncbi:helix-turn-helix domain-containing protein [Aurantiacibacter rhizosphaerae]|uniref:Helix-turn-helix domain-containing protein n=1 Tax=Aurantiacibacter rhizosphaerae TaxID=2691582 RepID=A0A844XEF0_9SPHN|nr:AraC family transcriptional regulator [Aurantiacibacter rhizosphaerae]MWV28857.1 helix-turn-helix domain-containing protein [Aurantiacibacter rhizosphaerae]
MKIEIRVSEDMVSYIGQGPFPDGEPMKDTVVFAFFVTGQQGLPWVAYRDAPDLDGLEGSQLVFMVRAEACQRVFSRSRGPSANWHLPEALHRVALSITDCEGQGEARKTLRLARSIELLCQLHAHLDAGDLVTVDCDTDITAREIESIVRARRIIDQRWREKLTIPLLAREVGVNRDKLVRRFREVYGETIHNALSERRLDEARTLLLSSDLPVSSVAHRCSYMSNASFTRAFSRRFGLAPTALRHQGIAA